MTASCAPFAVIPFHTIGKIKIYIYKLEKKTQETKSKPLFVQHKCGGCKQWKRQREREFSSRPAYKKSSFHWGLWRNRSCKAVLKQKKKKTQWKRKKNCGEAWWMATTVHRMVHTLLKSTTRKEEQRWTHETLRFLFLLSSSFLLPFFPPTAPRAKAPDSCHFFTQPFAPSPSSPQSTHSLSSYTSSVFIDRLPHRQRHQKKKKRLACPTVSRQKELP